MGVANTERPSVETTGRRDLSEFFLALTQLGNFPPLLVFERWAGQVRVVQIPKVEDLLTYADDTPAMGNWPGQWRSDYFQFTVGEARQWHASRPQAAEPMTDEMAMRLVPPATKWQTAADARAYRNHLQQEDLGIKQGLPQAHEKLARTRAALADRRVLVDAVASEEAECAAATRKLETRIGDIVRELRAVDQIERLLEVRRVRTSVEATAEVRDGRRSLENLLRAPSETVLARRACALPAQLVDGTKVWLPPRIRDDGHPVASMLSTYGRSVVELATAVGDLRGRFLTGAKTVAVRRGSERSYFMAPFEDVLVACDPMGEPGAIDLCEGDFIEPWVLGLLNDAARAKLRLTDLGVRAVYLARGRAEEKVWAFSAKELWEWLRDVPRKKLGRDARLLVTRGCYDCGRLICGHTDPFDRREDLLVTWLTYLARRND